MANSARRKKRQKQNITPLLLILAGVILVGALAVWGLINSVGNQQAGIPNNTDQVQRISLADAKAAFDSGQAVFLDVRSDAAYQVGHIPGATLIPIGELETRMAELDPNAWIITYCT